MSELLQERADEAESVQHFLVCAVWVFSDHAVRAVPYAPCHQRLALTLLLPGQAH